jgi:zinc protease
MPGQANDLGGSWLSANDLNFSERYLSAVKRVTPGDIQRLARQYLTAQNRTVYALLPTGAAPKAVVNGEVSSERPIQEFELSNGLRLLVKEDHRLPFVEFRSVFRGGVLAETPANNGITQLMGKMLLKGTSSRSAEEIATQIESIGGSLDSYGGNNSFGVNAEVMSGDFNTGLELLSDVLLNPTFPAPALEREREVQCAAIRDQRDHLLQSAAKAMRRGLFGETAYGLDPLGDEASVEKLQVSGVRAFHDQLARPNNCVLAIFGDINPAEVRSAVEKAFAKWKSNPSAILPKDSGAGTLAVTKRVTETRDKKQAVLVVGFRGAALHEPDRYPLELIQEACSDLGSRLFLRVREKLGLAYYVGAQNFVGLVPGYFAFYAGTMPEKVDVVEKELLLEAYLLRGSGLTPEELKRAKAKIIGQRKIARQDLGSLAMTSALDELYGLGYNHSETEDALYEAVTLDQIKAAAKKYLTPHALVVSIIKP